MPEDECPFCGRLVANLSDHTRICPSLVTKRSPQVVFPPGQEPYEEGELPPHLKEVIRRKGSLLTEADVEFEEE